MKTLQISGKRILLTGGAGFIGTALARRLVASNEVVILDGFFRPGPWSEAARPREAELIRGNVLDEADVQRALSGSQVVVHMAAIAGIETVGKHPVQTLEVNLLGTANVLRAAAEAGIVERVVNFSTSEVLGRNADRLSEHEDNRVGPAGELRWTYAASKLAGEHLAFAYWSEKNLPTVSVRPFNIYGPGQVGEGAIHNFVVRALEDQPLTIHGAGTQVRAWCYIDDLVDGVLACMTRPEATGQVFNLGNAQAYASTRELARMVIELTGSRSVVEQGPGLSEEVAVRIPDTTKAKRLLGFEAKVGLEEGIRRTAEFYRKQLQDPRR